MKQNSRFRYHDSQRAGEIWPSMTKLSLVLNKQQMHTNWAKMIPWKSKKKDLNRVNNWNWANNSRKLCNTTAIKAMNHILTLSRSEEGNGIECEKYKSGRLLLTLTESNTILTKSKPHVQKTLICSKSGQGTAESSGATRFSNTSVEVQ